MDNYVQCMVSSPFLKSILGILWTRLCINIDLDADLGFMSLSIHSLYRLHYKCQLNVGGKLSTLLVITQHCTLLGIIIASTSHLRPGSRF